MTSYDNSDIDVKKHEPTNAVTAKLYCLENTFKVKNMNKDESTRVVFTGTYTPTLGYAPEDPEAAATYWNGWSGDFVSYNNVAVKVKNVKSDIEASCSDKKLSEIVDDATELAYIARQLGLTLDSSVKVNYYKAGKTYYTAVIRHFEDTEHGLTQGWGLEADKYTDLVGKVEPFSTVADLDKYLLGRFGVVRNNWYEVTVNTISGPGVPEDPEPDPDDPDDNPKDQYIKCSINILSWAKRSHNYDL